MELSEYIELIQLDKKIPKVAPFHSPEEYQDSVLHLVEITGNLVGQDKTCSKNVRSQLRANLNILPAFTLKEQDVKILDTVLQFEMKNKLIADAQNLQIETKSQGTNLSIWKGNITQLRIDAIVNAANSQLEGCFIPLHNCIDNAIHSAAGVQLRDDCAKIIQQQSHIERTGTSKITRAYNLPGKYVIHTVGPIVRTQLTDKEIPDLYNSYISCLDLALESKRIKSLAFCCISTGIFGFPKKEAATIAIQTITNWLKKHPNTLEHIVFNVFDDENDTLYHNLINDVPERDRIMQ